MWGGETLNWGHHTGRGNTWGPLDLSGLHLTARPRAHMSLPDSAKLLINHLGTLSGEGDNQLGTYGDGGTLN